MLAHPLVVEDLGDVGLAGAGQKDHDDGIGRKGAGHAQGGDHGVAGRAADEEAFLAGEAAGHGEGVAIADALPAVDQAKVDGVGDVVHADAFDLVRLGGVARVDRAFGVGAHDDDVRLAFLEVLGRAGDGAAGADRGHEVGDLAFGLVPDFGAGGQVVGLGVLVVVELVGLVGAGDLAGEAVGDLVVGVGMVLGDGGGRDHDLGAVGPEQIAFLLAHLVGHGEDAAVALDRGGDRQTHAGVARGRLHDGASGLQESTPLGVFDHVKGGAILHRAAGVEVFDFGQDGRLDPFGHAVKLDQGGSADRVQHGMTVMHGRPFRGVSRSTVT
ncbi:hypothetical protein D3C87_1101880 [compost metagenome]